MSDTPRTDALIARHTEETDRTYALLPANEKANHAMRQVMEYLEHALALERENAKLREALENVIDFRGASGAFEWINDKRTVAAFEKARAALGRRDG